MIVLPKVPPSMIKLLKLIGGSGPPSVIVHGLPQLNTISALLNEFKIAQRRSLGFPFPFPLTPPSTDAVSVFRLTTLPMRRLYDCGALVPPTLVSVTLRTATAALASTVNV